MDRKGVIQGRFVNADYTQRTEPAAVIDVLAGLYSFVGIQRLLSIVLLFPCHYDNLATLASPFVKCPYVHRHEGMRKPETFFG